MLFLGCQSYRHLHLRTPTYFASIFRILISSRYSIQLLVSRFSSCFLWEWAFGCSDELSGPLESDTARESFELIYRIHDSKDTLCCSSQAWCRSFLYSYLKLSIQSFRDPPASLIPYLWQWLLNRQLNFLWPWVSERWEDCQTSPDPSGQRVYFHSRILFTEIALPSKSHSCLDYFLNLLNSPSFARMLSVVIAKDFHCL